MKYKKAGENCIIRNLMVGAPQEILLRRSSQENWEGMVGGGKNRGTRKYIQGFGSKMWRKITTWKTRVEIER